jgi:hypothetical protein
MRYQVLLDGIEFPGSDPMWIGPDQKMVVAIEVPDGSLQAHYVEVIEGRSSHSLGRLGPEVGWKLMIAMHQAG